MDQRRSRGGEGAEPVSVTGGRMKKIFVVLLTAVIFIAGGCAKKAEEKKLMPVPRGDALVIISPHWEGVRKEFGDAFKK